MGSVACNSNTFYVFNSCVFHVSRTCCALFTRLGGNYYLSSCNLCAVRPSVFELSEI